MQASLLEMHERNQLLGTVAASIVARWGNKERFKANVCCRQERSTPSTGCCRWTVMNPANERLSMCPLTLTKDHLLCGNRKVSDVLATASQSTGPQAYLSASSQDVISANDTARSVDVEGKLTVAAISATCIQAGCTAGHRMQPVHKLIAKDVVSDRSGKYRH